MLKTIQYDDFWAQPLETSTMWLGLLYAALALGFRFQSAMGARQPGDSDLANDSVRIKFYREKAVQCKQRLLKELHFRQILTLVPTI
jgi:hypothetical protein